ncbi:FUSC family protein [Pseudomonas syringae]|uniref:FUSC family protein n=1 Tax=Pseudomonas syringae pv. papulans TaxID=83963 RepID=A0A0P9WZ67_PSESX|nr:FUSC family protein [Pseudomonas syringae]KPY25870.1 Fusaric acid resistance protein region [Pseudomonas syringae pv. papulans]KWS34360.1 fusaric acid resistance protein [Pseudomonas syringae pv. papulans]MDH4603091.1 FUSC family protein [Pseudomonas syringae pv. papulans]MDH4624606.1 FUSC family protein [Pseudomonas syringae pv. papulans]RMN50913.1 Fusaric acid resistance protein region [Pseudomonas syringae pv. papulans]
MIASLQRITDLPWRRELHSWARSDGVTWVYIFKVLLAAFLTYWLALRLELPQPHTAMITVFIVMQPQSGQVFAKSFYRLLGTLAGSAMMVLLMALFAQNSLPFLGSLALWVGLCSAGAARYRNFRAYGFVLAGYTAAMVGLPALAHPEGSFMSAVWRVLEITLGILCSTAISAAVLPQSSSAAMRNALYLRFGGFARFVVNGLRGDISRTEFETGNVRFVAEAIGLEGLRSVTVFEDPHMRRRNGRLNRLNSEFMAVTTRFNALHQLLERLRLEQAEQVLKHIDPGLENLAELLDGFADRALTNDDAVLLVTRLESCRAHFPERVRSLRAELEHTLPSDAERLDFHTSFELLYRLLSELLDYARTHASLADHSHEREQWKGSFVPRTHWMTALAAGARATCVVGLMSVYWVLTAWPSGASMVLASAATVALSSTTHNPRRMSLQMAGGTLLGALSGFIETFFLFPHIDGFPLLCLLLAPVFVLGAYLGSRPQWTGYGLGLLIFFSLGSVPDNLTVYDPYTFINDYLAMVVGMLICAAAGAIILPPNSRWMWQRLEQALRNQVVFAISAPLKRLGSSFESQTRDLMHQAYGLAIGKPLVQRELLRWMFVVLEIGHAIIELRHEQALLPIHPAYAEYQPWRIALRVMGRALVRLFIQPDAVNLQRCLSAVDQAIKRVQEADEPFASHFDTSVLRRVKSYLHFIRTSLLDPQSPLAAYGVARTASGVAHAA